MLVISNPNAGDKSGPKFLKDIVLPFITELLPNAAPVVKETTKPGDAGFIVEEYIKSNSSKDPIVVLISGGDTTLHEIAHQLAVSSNKTTTPIHSILVPSGTANALYHSLFPPDKVPAFRSSLSEALNAKLSNIPEEVQWKLYSVLAFHLQKAPRPLTLTSTTFFNSQAVVTERVVSIVVVSSSLHAAILQTAETLRDSHPGIERFKVAAQQNITRWSDAELLIHGDFEVYDPNSNTFQLRTSSSPTTSYAGPFAYFLSTVNVDRLEQAFVITPLANTIPPPQGPDGRLDIVLLRPTRDPSLTGKPLDDTAKQTFAQRTMSILGGVYNNGAHTRLRYGSDGQIGGDGDGELVVEYLRASAWEWKPVHELSGLICADGEIFSIPEGGSARTEVLKDGPQIAVYGGLTS